MGIFVIVGVLIALAITGIIDIFVEPEPFNESPQVKEPEQIPIQKEGSGEVASAFGEGQVNGYYLVTTQDTWYGDYIDGREIPSKINLDKDSKINFRCFEDEHLRTSIYFGTFRNNIMNDLNVKVFIDGIQVEEKTTNGNQALIVEGSCYSQQPTIKTESITPVLPDVVTANVTGLN